MKLGVTVPYAHARMSRAEVVEFVRAADALGYDSVWVPEAWSFDAFMLLASLAERTEHVKLGTAVVNVFSRTPSLIGQSVATLDALSAGRAILGLGASGPQVIEGWHGMPFEKPLRRTRETVEIVRTILRREPLNYQGEMFRLDKGLKLINHPVRADVPVCLAAMGPRNVEMAAEIADGWMPVLYSPTRAPKLLGDALARGFARRPADADALSVTPAVTTGIDGGTEAEDIARAGLALYIGGMGSREHNFYNDLVSRYGWASEAGAIQELYLGGRQSQAARQVSTELLDEVTAVGPAGKVEEKFDAFREAGCDGLVLDLAVADHASRMKTLERAIQLV